MASMAYFLLLSLLSHSFLLTKCDVDDDDLFRGINQYRASLNLSPLNMAEVADCFADDIADSYNNQICTTTTAPFNTTLPKFSDYPAVVAKCGPSATGGGQILPACIPDQQQTLSHVLSTFTTNYATFLNSTQFSDIGIASDDDWIVLVLTNTTAAGGGSNGGSGPVDDDDDLLLRGINQYRASLNLTSLNMANGADCLADEIADTYNNKICTNTTAPYNTTLPKFSDYPGVITKCGLSTINATGEGQILPACIPSNQQSLGITRFIADYANYLNSIQFSDIGIGSEDDWIVVVLTNTTTTGGGSNGGSGSGSIDDDDDLLRGINQYRASLNLTSLNIANGADCLADEIADTYNNKICTNTTAPYNTTLPKFSDYPGVITKCGLSTINATGEGQILPACIPSNQQSLGITRFIADYANYLNSTQFSDIGIGSEDDWIVVVLANTSGGGSNTTGGGSNTTEGGSNTTGGGRNGASSLAAISPVVFSIICLFMLV